MVRWFDLGLSKRPVENVKDLAFVLVAMFGALLVMVLAALYDPWWGVAAACWVLTQWRVPWPE